MQQVTEPAALRSEDLRVIGGEFLNGLTAYFKPSQALKLLLRNSQVVATSGDLSDEDKEDLQFMIMLLGEAVAGADLMLNHKKRT